VPPPKCPECGRFLKLALVASLTSDPVPCPRCETGLVAAMFPQETSVRPPDLGTDAAATTELSVSAVAAAAEARGSVRPPDLVPVTVRDEPRDVLAGWDEHADPADLVRWREDRPPFPTDTVIVAGAGVLGVLAGALVPPRRGRNAAIGGLAGVVGAALVRQIWRLDP
jgi:hypothetical protein